MSTDRKRLSSAIQRIAREDPDIRDIIADYKNRGGIGSTSATVAGADDGRQICCDGSSSGSSNPGSETRDPSEGGQDGLNPDNPANLDEMGPGSLGGVTDCTTGEPICFSGADWVPPEGWDSPTDPPLDSDYDSDKYYQVFVENSGNVTSVGYYQLCSSAMSAGNSFMTEDDCAIIISCDNYSAACPSISRVARVNTLNCEATPNPICDEPAPLEDFWPSDSCVNLAIKGGSIVGSKYDPENDGSYSKPMSEIELCDDFGNSFFLRPSAGGGWKTINATKDAGYLWGSNGQKIAHINGNEYSDPDI